MIFRLCVFWVALSICIHPQQWHHSIHACHFATSIVRILPRPPPSIYRYCHPSFRLSIHRIPAHISTVHELLLGLSLPLPYLFGMPIGPSPRTGWLFALRSRICDSVVKIRLIHGRIQRDCLVSFGFAKSDTREAVLQVHGSGKPFSFSEIRFER